MVAWVKAAPEDGRSEPVRTDGAHRWGQQRDEANAASMLSKSKQARSIYCRPLYGIAVTARPHRVCEPLLFPRIAVSSLAKV